MIGRRIETLRNNSYVKERLFYHLNERFVPNKTGDIIFSTSIFRTLHIINILTVSMQLADACRNTKLFLEE